MWMMGAHPLKVGLSPILLDLLKRGYVSGVSSHGAFAIHDSEIALFGRTSEEVAETLSDGRFGMRKRLVNSSLMRLETARENRSA